MRATLLGVTIVTLLAPGIGLVAQAAEDPVPPANRPDPAALRERAKSLSPEQRQKMIREFREKHGLGGTNQGQFEKRWKELKQLPPAERAEKMKELRQEIQQGRGGFKLLSSGERDGKRKEMKERIDAQVSELEKRRAGGALTEAEQRRLERMRQMSKKLEQPASSGPRRPLPPGQLPPPNPDKAPIPNDKPQDGTLPK